MSTLDERLKKIILEGVYDMGSYDVEGIDPESVDETIPEIKQAFIDEGWVSQPVLKYVMQTKGNEVIMTGPEWYARFEQEFELEIFMTWHTRTGNDSHEILDRDQIRRIAERASGVKG